MEFHYDEQTNLTRISIIKEKDICAECPEDLRESCPLLMAIIDNIVYPAYGSLEIASCILLDKVPKSKQKKKKED